jgi:hypothetical protein
VKTACSVCVHLSHADVEATLSLSVPVRSISERPGLSRAEIRKHRRPESRREYWRFKNWLRRFGGHRPDVLCRDKEICVSCGRAATVVHHRLPGKNDPSLLVSLCRACHNRIHRWERIKAFVSAEFSILWQEQHPAAPLQLSLSLSPDCETCLALQRSHRQGIGEPKVAGVNVSRAGSERQATRIVEFPGAARRRQEAQSRLA